MESKTIEHEGVVTRVEGDEVSVMIVSRSACSACHAKGACGISEMKNKEIRTAVPDFPVKTGDRVRVVAGMRNAMLSVMMAYVVPSVVLLGSVAVLLVSGTGELAAACGALVITTVYFFTLYQFRSFFSKKIKFEIKIPQF